MYSLKPIHVYMHIYRQISRDKIDFEYTQPQNISFWVNYCPNDVTISINHQYMTKVPLPHRRAPLWNAPTLPPAAAPVPKDVLQSMHHAPSQPATVSQATPSTATTGLNLQSQQQQQQQRQQPNHRDRGECPSLALPTTCSSTYINDQFMLTKVSPAYITLH